MKTRKTKKSRRKMGRNNRLGKRRRGSGCRGGVGRAGHGKRAKQKKQMYAHEPQKKGFSPKRFSGMVGVNLSWIDKNLDKIQKDGVVNVLNFGYEKVLGKGKLKKPTKIKAKHFSNKAIEKIKQAGGEAIKC